METEEGFRLSDSSHSSDQSWVFIINFFQNANLEHIVSNIVAKQTLALLDQISGRTLCAKSSILSICVIIYFCKPTRPSTRPNFTSGQLGKRRTSQATAHQVSSPCKHIFLFLALFSKLVWNALGMMLESRIEDLVCIPRHTFQSILFHQATQHRHKARL